MTDESPGDPNIHADENSIAIGSISVGGNVGDIRIGHTIGLTSAQVSTLLTQITTTFQPKPFDGRCPYKGLDYFEEADAHLFFGREKLVSDLVSRIQKSSTLFITGPSGSGKSSLGRAGLIHALKQGKVPGSDKWMYATMKPGREPITTLARAMAGLVMSSNAEEEIRARAMNDETIFARWCEIALQDGRDKRVMLYIDQFEEVFTQVSREEERIAFLNLLTHSTSVENGRVSLLFSMRSDFIPNCAAYPKLNAVLNREFIQIGSMQENELVNAIAQPALRVGLKIDPGLIVQVINDMHGEPGALPLMQFALKDLFDAQQENGGVFTLALSDYLERGGIQQALERHADATFSQLNENEQELARSIFTGLIEIGRGTQHTRRTAVFHELVPANQHSADVEAIVRKLADARLITTDEVAGKDTVTISHEKLIEAWPWLKKLVNENQDVIALQNEIAADAKEWDGHQRDASYLYSGARLATAQEKMSARQLLLSGLAQDFIEQGISLQEAERKAKETLRRRITLGLIMGIVVALGLAFFGLYQASRATRQAVISRSQVLAANAQKNESAVQKNLLLSIEAYRLVESFSYSESILSEQTLRDSLGRVSGLPLSGHEGFITTLAFSPDGEWLATGSWDNTARLWNVKNPSAQPIILRGHENIITTLAFSPDGEWLATGSSDATTRLWNVKDPSAEPIILRGHESNITTLAFSPDGAWLATGSYDSTARLWNAKDPSAEPIVLRGHENTIRALVFSPDGAWLATGSYDSTARLWNVKDPSAEPIILHGHESTISALVFSPDGAWLATGSEDSTARLWNVKDPSAEPIILHGHESTISALAFSPDGAWLATGSEDNTARLWNVKDPSAEPIILRGHEYDITTLAFSPDGAWLASGSKDHTARLWNVKDPSAEPIILRGHEDVITILAFSPDGAWLATGSYDNTARLWNVKNPSAEPIILRGHEGNISALAFSPDGAWLATGSWDNTARLWNLKKNVILEKACQVVGRNFTRDEWTTFFPSEEYRQTCEQWSLQPELKVMPTATP